MKKGLVVVQVLVLLTFGCIIFGCESASATNADGSKNTNTVNKVLEGMESNKPVIDAIVGAGDKATGGLASIVWGILGTAIAGGLAVNEKIVSYKRGKALVEVHMKKGTPSVTSQVSTEGSVKLVSKLVKHLT